MISLNTAPPRRRLISLTPLIDVVFILLIFFMLASSFLDWRAFELALPPEQTVADAPVGDADTLLIELYREELRLAGEKLTQPQVLERVARQMAIRPDVAIFVRPAAEVTLQQTVHLLDNLVWIGATDVTLIGQSGP